MACPRRGYVNYQKKKGIALSNYNGSGGADQADIGIKKVKKINAEKSAEWFYIPKRLILLSHPLCLDAMSWRGGKIPKIMHRLQWYNKSTRFLVVTATPQCCSAVITINVKTIETEERKNMSYIKPYLASYLL